MTHTVFNLEKCTRCGICHETCPTGVIGITGDKTPALSSDAAENCVACGHCEAICPAGAVTVSGPDLKAAEGLTAPASLTPEQVGFYFRNRRSIRRYTATPVDKKIIEQLIDITRFAPTAVNGQPVRWLVLYDSVHLQRIVDKMTAWMKQAVAAGLPVASRLGFEELIASREKGEDPVCRKAPHLVIAYAHKDNPVAVTDAHIALETLDLAAPAFGLGTCWAGYFTIIAGAAPDIAREAGVPQDHVVLGSLMIGYPQYRYQRLPKRNAASLIWK